MKEYNYMKALRALREGRNTNPGHKNAFHSLISDLKKKNPHWDRKSVDDHDSITNINSIQPLILISYNIRSARYSLRLLIKYYK